MKIQYSVKKNSREYQLKFFKGGAKTPFLKKRILNASPGQAERIAKQYRNKLQKKDIDYLKKVS